MNAYLNSRRAGLLLALNFLIFLIVAISTSASGKTPWLADRVAGNRTTTHSRAASPSILPGTAPVLNEILYWPDKRKTGSQFVEVYNPTTDPVNLAGWILSNNAASRTVALPAWVMPGSAYLVIRFEKGHADPDFGDGSATFFAEKPKDFFDQEQDGAALYRGTPGPANLVDFVAWSDTGEFSGGAAHDDAVAADLWPEHAFFKSLPLDPIALRRPVLEGESIGRDALGTDTNTPDDWGPLGGKDALSASPGAANGPDFDAETITTLAGTVEAASQPMLAEQQRQQQPLGPCERTREKKRRWTVMVFMDPRDTEKLLQSWLNDINQMEKSGSDANVNVVVQIGSRPPEGGAPGNAHRYCIKPNKLLEFAVPVTEAVNPGDPKTLKDFIAWAKTEFPANHFAIVLAGHGQGWKGIMIAGSADHLTMAELSSGLAGTNFDVVLFYSCLMGQIEVGEQIAGQAAMMVASEEVTHPIFPWKDFLDQLKKHSNWNAGQFADNAAQDFAGALKDRLKGKPAQDQTFTMASVDLSKLTGTLRPKVSAFAAKLGKDVEDYKAHDRVLDNVQIRLKKEVVEKAETFNDRNFKDLFHFAELVHKLPITAAGDAQGIMDTLTKGNKGVIRWEDHGAGHPNAHGLSIYFPHNEVAPSEGGDIEVPSKRAFDDPTFGTHLYARDAAILIPRLRNTLHPLMDDSGFRFPTVTEWDEFLHRYYKPVADACIRRGKECVSQATVKAGDTVDLSGLGSSDSDGPAPDDEPAHIGGILHWYWDFDSGHDHAAPKPDYREGMRFLDCKKGESDDCDRDDEDENDDDPDAQGRIVKFTCPDVNKSTDFRIRLMVWDEHHDQERQHVEDRAHNQGRHWLHFNVDDDWVTVTCKPKETPTPTQTSTSTSTPMSTPTPTDSPTPTGSPTPTDTATTTDMPTPTDTPTPTGTPEPSSSGTPGSPP